jgi:copper chaperone CopZ
MSSKIFLVEGMTCKNCKAHVENGLKGIQGIDEVNADLLTGLVTVNGNQVNDELIKTAIEKAGYRFKGSDKIGNPGSDHWLS